MWFVSRRQQVTPFDHLWVSRFHRDILMSLALLSLLYFKVPFHTKLGRINMWYGMLLVQPPPPPAPSSLLINSWDVDKPEAWPIWIVLPIKVIWIQRWSVANHITYPFDNLQPICYQISFYALYQINCQTLPNYIKRLLIVWLYLKYMKMR